VYFLKKFLDKFILPSSQHQKDYTVECRKGPQFLPQIELTVGITEYHTDNYYKFNLYRTGT